MSETQTLVGRGGAAGYPRVTFNGGAESLQGEAAWRARGPKVPVAFHAEIDAQLEEHRARAAREAASNARMTEDDARRAEVHGAPDEDLRADTVAEMRADFDRHEAERPQRVEALLGRAVELLEVLARSRR